MANWSGLWNQQYGVPYSQLGGNTSEQNSTQNLAIAKHLRTRGQKILAELIYQLTGVAAGATATVTTPRVTGAADLANPLSQGGARPVAAATDINRVTTAADQTYIRGLMRQAFGPVVNSGYPVDKAGNGGGSKLGAF